MLIKKGQKLKIKHSRKGTFIGIATDNFNPYRTNFWPIRTCDHIQGMSQNWIPGEKIYCRFSFIKTWKLV